MTRIDIEPIMTIEPPPRAFMCGMTACESWTAPNRFTSKMRRQSSMLASSTGS